MNKLVFYMKIILIIAIVALILYCFRSSYFFAVGLVAIVIVVACDKMNYSKRER